MLLLHLNVPSGRDLPLRRVEAGVRVVFQRVRGEGSSGKGFGDKGPGGKGPGGESPAGEDGDELSITFLEDGPIRDLNRVYLGHDWVPDVLSFTFPEPPPLGDIYVGMEQAARQAMDEGVSFEEELVRLAVHGTLHVLGYEHPEDPGEREASEQYRIQEAVVREVMGDAPDVPRRPGP